MKMRPISGWAATLDLEFAVRGERTVLASRRHSGPLVVQRPFYPEGGVCHVYVLHPPGGVVGGDELANRFDLAGGTHVLVTTPAATKFYRSDGHSARQAQELELLDADCEYLPQESIVFGGAHARLSTSVRLAGKSRFIGWEMTCLGRPASGETFARGRLQQGFELWRDGTPLFVDRLAVAGEDPAVMRGRSSLGGYPVLGTLLGYPATAEDVEAARPLAAARQGDTVAGVTLVDSVLVVRAVAGRSDSLRDLFVAVWQRLRPRLLGRPAVAPRVWAT